MKKRICITALCAMLPFSTCSAAASDMEKVPYLQRLDLSVPIFDGPSYDGCYAGIVGRSTLYTIVEEQTDDEGNLWGRLKSGAGWVDLTRVSALEQEPAPVTAYYADDELLEDMEYLEYKADAGEEYLVKIAFQAKELLKDVRFAVMGEGATEPLYTMDALAAEDVFVAGVTFPGDSSAYEIFFADETGTEYQYTVSVSGRNGALVFGEY